MFIDINKGGLLKDKQIEILSPFNRTLYSKHLQKITKYKNILQKQFLKHNTKNRSQNIYNKVERQKRNKQDERELNTIDNIITKSMLKVEQKVQRNKYTCPWEPEHHLIIKNIMLWKLILTQYKTILSRRIDIDNIKLNHHSKLPIEWKSLGHKYNNIKTQN